MSATAELDDLRTILARPMSDRADAEASCAYAIPAGPAVYVATLRDALPLLSPTVNTIIISYHHHHHHHCYHR